MNIKRVLATGMAALMAGSTLAIGGLGQNTTATPAATAAPAAATTLTMSLDELKDALATGAATDSSGLLTAVTGVGEVEVLATAQSLDFKTLFADAVAKVRDVAAGGTVKPAGTTGAGAVGTTTGGTTKHVNFGSGGTGGTALSVGANAFTTGAWGTTVVPQLKSGKVSWKSSEYDYKETLTTTGVMMRNAVGEDKVNGTLTMEIQADELYLSYVFNKALNITTANSKGNKETESFELTDPVSITFLGKTFKIIGIAAGKLIVLNGATGEASPTKAVEYTTSDGKKYSAYATDGADGSWATVTLKDASGAQVGEKTINKGSNFDFETLGLTVEVISVRTTTVNQNTIVKGADIVVGPKGKTKKTIDTSTDVTSTGTSNDALFEGFSEWGLRTSGTLTAGQAEVNDELRLVYKPSSTKYLKAGEALKMPGGLELRNEGYNTARFVTVTFAPLDDQSIKNITTGSTSSLNKSWSGISISGDVAKSVGGAKDYWDKMGIFFRQQLGSGVGTDTGGKHPVLIAYHDGTEWVGNGTELATINSSIYQTAAGGPNPYLNSQGVDTVLAIMNQSTNDGVLVGTVNYTFRLNYGGSAEKTFYVNTTLGLANQTEWLNFTIGRAIATGDAAARYGLRPHYRNRSTWTSADSGQPEFKLGSSYQSADDDDVTIVTEDTSETTPTQVGKKTQAEIIDNSGILVLNQNSNGAGDKLVVKVPDKELQGQVYVGSPKTTGTPTYESAANVLAQVKAGTLAKNLILVGGPCANEVVEYLAGTVATDTLPTCQEWVGGATPKYTKGLVGVWAVGTKKALVIAGTAKADTDAFASDFKLKGVTSVAPA